MRKWIPSFRASTHTTHHTDITTVWFFVSFPPYLCTCFYDGRVNSKPQPDGEQRQKSGVLANIVESQTPKQSKDMEEKLKQVADLITANTIITTKEVLTSDEAARYLGVSLSCLYKWTMSRAIPHYKPMGKMCYFNRKELEEWLQRNRVQTDDELEEQAQTILRKGGKL